MQEDYPDTDDCAGIAMHTNLLAILEEVVADHDGSVISLLRNNGDRTFAPQLNFVENTLGSGLVDIVAADINGDGVVDFAVANSTSKSIGIFFSQP